MVPENPEENERKPKPASWWKAPPLSMETELPDPPITRHVFLPEKVAVRYLAEVSGQELKNILVVMRRLWILVEPNRSVDFPDAARILRKYGIEARRSP